MRYEELITESTRLGGFEVTPLHIEDSEMDEDLSRRGFLKGAGALAAGAAIGGVAHAADKPDPEQLIATVVIDGDSKEFNLTGKFKGDTKTQLNQASDFITDFLEARDINFSNLVLRYQGKILRTQNAGSIKEALKLDAPQKKWSRDELHGYVDRIQTDTKTKSDKFKPIIHGSNVKAITKSDDPDSKWDLDDLARQIMTRPSMILGTNAKMAKSKEEGAMTYDLTLPALSGIVVDEETGEFVEIKTCPGAGECQLFCYARKGGYRMFPASSMSAAQALNFLVNDPEGYMAMFDREVKAAQKRTDKAGIKLLVRIHDAGDFFSKEYYDLAMNVAKNNPGAKFYFYTKMGEIATDANAPANVVGQFSGGAQSREVKKVEFTRNAGRHVKDAITLPKDMFRDLFVTDAKGKYVKDEKGRTQVKGDAEWNQFKQKLASAYKIDAESIITYDQMNKIPEGPTPKWNVVVFPAGHGDLGASRLDVAHQFLMFH
jgi:hypothetical protein